MDDGNDYERMRQSLTNISQHPEYPGKGDLVRECLVEIEERQRLGRLNKQQSLTLTAILLPEVGTVAEGAKSLLI